MTYASRSITRHSTLAKVGAISVGAVFALSSCGGGTSSGSQAPGTTQPTSAPPGSTATLHVGHTSLGSVLVDSAGMTVYLLTSDAPDASHCSAQCLAYWPPVPPVKTGIKPAGVTAPVGRTDSTAGSPMLTVGGWPMYTFANDKAPGDVTGEGVASDGGVWYAVSPSGQAVKAAPAAAPSSSSRGGGY